MNILFLPGKYPFCYYYRGFLPGVYSNQMVVKDFPALGEKASTKSISEQVRKSDVVVLQRPNTKERLEFACTLKSSGRKVIFENDDTYKIDLDRLESDEQRKIAVDFQHYTEEILKVADGAIASTEILAKEYAEINPNVAVLKNCIDPLDEFPVKRNDTGKFRIGFIASVTTNDDYHHMRDQIHLLDQRGDITIVVLGLKYPDGSHISFMSDDVQFWYGLKNAEYHPYVPVTEYMSTLASLALDLAVIPRKDNYFNRCKSNIKALEMSLLQIPVLAQAFSDGKSPYQGDLSPYLTLVEDNSTWYSKIIEIRDNYETYKAKAVQAHDKVLRDYNIQTYAPEWVKKIEELCKYQRNT